MYHSNDFERKRKQDAGQNGNVNFILASNGFGNEKNHEDKNEEFSHWKMMIERHYAENEQKIVLGRFITCLPA